MPDIKLIECPRDAMQGIHEFISTENKVEYIQSLINIGFDTLDAGSFVSAQAIPQMRDTPEVLSRLDFTSSKTKLLVIVANERGAEDASKFENVNYMGFPFSISEEFQMRNTNSSISDALKRVDHIQDLCVKSGKELVIYISMAFGNPYGEEWNVEIAEKWTEVMVEKGIKIISLADTIGTSTEESIQYLIGTLSKSHPEIELGAHIHTVPSDALNKVKVAYQSGCRRFDGAIRGYGGCPMATDSLVGNMPTEIIKGFFDQLNIDLGINEEAFSRSMSLATQTFPNN